jgi:uncharacterized protein YuzE
VKLTVDRDVDAAYISLVESIGVGGVKKTYSCDPREVNGMINLDFDAEGRLIGIEVLDASRLLPETLLDEGE